MAVPPGVLQRAVLVAVPLALVALIFVTPAVIRPRHTQPTDIPLLLVEVTDERWNATVNETALLYVRSALGFTLYDRIWINVSGFDGTQDGNRSSAGTRVHSLEVKVPVSHGWVGNVSAAAVREDATFRTNATIEFGWDPDGWLLRVRPGGATTFRVHLEPFSASMRREAAP
jgi:hypothetical protein